ncbi:MAG: CBS domain-containing protein, partial [Woeseiaceae bacterium]
LLLTVGDVMHKGTQAPVINVDGSLADALLEMTRKGLGFTTVTDSSNRLAGIFTDGDLRRLLETKGDLRGLNIREVMTSGGYTVRPEALAAEAVRLMETHKINALPVVDGNQKVVGALNIHDLFRAGVV